MTCERIDARGLDRFQAEVRTCLSRDLMCLADTRVRLDVTTGNVLMSVKLSILGAMLHRHGVTVPATWWDAFKAEALPWWLRWMCRPARFRDIILDARLLYPDLSEKAIGAGGVFVFVPKGWSEHAGPSPQAFPVEQQVRA